MINFATTETFCQIGRLDFQSLQGISRSVRFFFGFQVTNNTLNEQRRQKADARNIIDYFSVEWFDASLKLSMETLMEEITQAVRGILEFEYISITKAYFEILGQLVF